MDECMDLFYLEGMADIERDLEDMAAAARAVKTRSRIQARRASSEALLSKILPEEIEDGDAWHVISSGDVDSLSFLAHLLNFTALDYVAFSTWCMAVDDVEKLGVWLRNKRIGRLDAYVGEIFPGSYAKEHADLCETVRTGGACCHLPQSLQGLFVPRRNACMGYRIQCQHQHKPQNRKYRHYIGYWPIQPSQSLFRQHQEFRSGF